MSHPQLRHVLIPDAALPLPVDQPRPPLPALPHLHALLRRWRPVHTIEGDADSPATPCEQTLAAAHGLPGAPGRIPWAALESGTFGTPCAWLQPCHWQLGMDHVMLADPAALDLSEAQSRALLAAAAPLLRDDGIALRYVRPDAWLAQGEVFRDLSTWSVARALGRRLTPALLAGAADAGQGALLRRLQNEVQMLFYTHPVNDAREAARQLPVNALWISGAGVLGQAPAQQAEVLLEPRLTAALKASANAPLATAVAAHAAAWRAVDADCIAALQAAAEAGQAVRLTLCGERRAVTLAPAAGGLWHRISGIFDRFPVQNMIDSL